jgi:hypothetical protein
MSAPNADEARDALHGLDGIFVGMLSERELAAFNEMCRTGEARRSYEGAGGFMGLAKVRLNDKGQP